MIKKRFLSILISVLVIGCAGKSISDDKYLWLEVELREIILAKDRIVNLSHNLLAKGSQFFLQIF